MPGSGDARWEWKIKKYREQMAEKPGDPTRLDVSDDALLSFLSAITVFGQFHVNHNRNMSFQTHFTLDSRFNISTRSITEQYDHIYCNQSHLRLLHFRHVHLKLLQLFLVLWLVLQQAGMLLLSWMELLKLLVHDAQLLLIFSLYLSSLVLSAAFYWSWKNETETSWKTDHQSTH